MGAIAGTVFLTVDGVQLSIAGTITSSPFTVEREGLVGASGPAGHSEKPRIPFVEVEFFVDEETDLVALHAVDDATVQVQLITGKTHVFHHAFSVTAPEPDLVGGTTAMRFESLSADIT